MGCLLEIQLAICVDGYVFSTWNACCNFDKSES
jgi:hypothetical protein